MIYLSCHNARRVHAVCCSLLLAAILQAVSPVAFAQNSTTKHTPAYKTVHAPNAQRLVLAVMAAHPEAKLVGLHMVPPDGSQDVIIACNDEARIGKPSSAGDVAVRASRKTLTRFKEADGVYDIQMPLLDARGGLIGMMVELVTAKSVPGQQEATVAAEKLRAELQAKIPDSAWLFRDGN